MGAQVGNLLVQNNRRSDWTTRNTIWTGLVKYVIENRFSLFVHSGKRRFEDWPIGRIFSTFE